MRSPYLTAFEAANYLNVPLSTFRDKARRSRDNGGWDLIPVHLFPGPKGIRYRRSDILGIARRAEENRNREIAQLNRVREKAAKNRPLRLTG
jgi:hypothetical protein